MNALVERFGDRLAVLAFPCNQFGHQENATNDEIPRMLRYVRPGNDFLPKMDIFQKTDVNGADAHPIFKFLRQRLPIPADDSMHLMADPQLVTWTPVTRNDISWNFEKFLIRPDGVPHKRYSNKFLFENLGPDIDALLT
ncbi:unnamed protein product [Cyprideis torosa]|uniref:Glutathione peroxidase n=1 Tax=Cyprideis torosa TaxID=163714 RepID=A0A7R8ZKV2_9CRUS|nr:unnamed protein product [Cyprideis torosa]CAG0891966.1 unnamed protein product [Cyprideis torosa]